MHPEDSRPQTELKLGDSKPQILNDVEDAERAIALITINQDLERKISTLQKQLWLASEDKQNMQATLECQKDKAIKNLASKFEEINKKTLGEFKAIFERKLNDINEEKISLQEKLVKIDQKTTEDVAREREHYFDMKSVAESTISELEQQNMDLKRRCKKLSEDLGQLKKHKERVVNERKSDTIDKVTQTDSCTDIHSEDRPKELEVKIEDSLQFSLNDIHADVKNIAHSVSSLSESLLNNRSWGSDSGSLRAESQTNERNFDEDRLPSPRTESSCCSDAQVADEESRGDIHRLALPITETAFVVEGNRCEEPISEIAFGDGFRTSSPNVSLASDQLSPNFDNTATETVESSKSIEDDKGVMLAKTSIEDGDSGIFGSEYPQITDDEIEAQLHRIEDKYRRITKQLEGYENSRLENSDDDKHESKGKVELDPEIQKIIDEVNRQYHQYFFGNKTTKLT